MMQMMSIASGSSGNCIYVGTDDTHLIIDAGISGKKVEAGLNSIGLSMEDIDAVLVTHEHNDHIRGLGVLARRYAKPIYATPGTTRAIRQIAETTTTLGKIDSELFCPVEVAEDFTINDITLRPVPISHDAAEPVAYIARSGEDSVGVMTDLGTYDDRIRQEISGLDLLLIEANHDIRMLETGRYPYPLKMRIMGDRGHLSNEASGQLVGDVLHDHIKAVVLGHLSKENNLAELAYETVRSEITLGDNPYKGNDFPIYVAKRDCPSELLSTKPSC